jgi:hypothetical protein
MLEINFAMEIDPPPEGKKDRYLAEAEYPHAVAQRAASGRSSQHHRDS